MKIFSRITLVFCILMYNVIGAFVQPFDVLTQIIVLSFFWMLFFSWHDSQFIHVADSKVKEKNNEGE